MRILVVDDEESFLFYIGTVLTDRGYEVETAPSAQDAIDIFDATSIHLLLTDMVMPNQSGMSLIKQLRETAADLPAVVMSGYPVEQIDRLWREAPLTDVGFWQKSPDIAQLFLVIEQHLSGCKIAKISAG